jgi:hypothetical protein
VTLIQKRPDHNRSEFKRSANGSTDLAGGCCGRVTTGGRGGATGAGFDVGNAAPKPAKGSYPPDGAAGAGAKGSNPPAGATGAGEPRTGVMIGGLATTGTGGGPDDGIIGRAGMIPTGCGDAITGAIGRPEQTVNTRKP